jgi:hypothetical protein
MPGLPDGPFAYEPKSPIWVNFEGPWIRKCFNILWPFGKFYGLLVYKFRVRLVYFSLFWYVVPSKIWQSCPT